MTWLERIREIQFQITTGDGKVYDGDWKGSTMDIEFNTRIYNFIDVSGSLVRRKRPRGGHFPLVFWFQGGDHIDVQKRFLRSAKDSRPWTVTHPFYDTIVGQPIKISFDNSQYNVTKVTVDFWETISSVFPKSEIDFVSAVFADADSLNLMASNTYGAKINPVAGDVDNLRTDITTISDSTEGLGGSELVNRVALANGALNRYLQQPISAMQRIQNVITYPATLITTLNLKLSALIDTYEGLKANVIGSDANSKLAFEAQGVTLITTMCKAIIDSDYRFRSDVVSAQEDVRRIYDDFLAFIDAGQVLNGYTPDRQVQTALYGLVYMTFESLFSTAFDVSQEISVVLEKDMNLVTLTHMFSTLDMNDVNMVTLKDLNKLNKAGIFLLKTGQTITYFI